MTRTKAAKKAHRTIQDAIAIYGRGSQEHHAAIVKAAEQYRRDVAK